ncbi:MG2 domain-containing protein, partial [Carboxylicivirga linearis]
AQSWQEEIIKKLQLHQTIHHNEKVFVQTDRPIYVPGETIWLNAFIINAASQELNQTEVVLHVELLKPDKSIFIKEMFKIEKGLAAGQLELKENTKPGKYYLVAFTNWMRNAGSEYYFSKEIIVSGKGDSSRLTGIRTPSEQNNKLANDIGEVSELKQQLQVSFYPEGGDLVTGISSKVAFEVRDALGMPQNFNGLVVDENDQIVTAAKT